MTFISPTAPLQGAPPVLEMPRREQAPDTSGIPAFPRQEFGRLQQAVRDVWADIEPWVEELGIRMGCAAPLKAEREEEYQKLTERTACARSEEFAKERTRCHEQGEHPPGALLIRVGDRFVWLSRDKVWLPLDSETGWEWLSCKGALSRKEYRLFHQGAEAIYKEDWRSLERALVGLYRRNSNIDLCIPVHLQMGVLPALRAARKPLCPIMQEDGSRIDTIGLDGGGTLLTVAAGLGRLRMAQYLVYSGASVNYRENNRCYTPLHAAATNGHADMVKFLVESGADVNAVYEFEELGDTIAQCHVVFDVPLLCAMQTYDRDPYRQEKTDIIWYLLTMGAMPSAVARCLDADAGRPRRCELQQCHLLNASIQANEPFNPSVMSQNEIEDRLVIELCKGVVTPRVMLSLMQRIHAEVIVSLELCAPCNAVTCHHEGADPTECDSLTHRQELLSRLCELPLELQRDIEKRVTRSLVERMLDEPVDASTPWQQRRSWMAVSSWQRPLPSFAIDEGTKETARRCVRALWSSKKIAPSKELLDWCERRTRLLCGQPTWQVGLSEWTQRYMPREEEPKSKKE